MDPQTVFGAVDLACQKGDFLRAENLLVSFARTNPKNVEALVGLGVIAVRTGRNKLAISRFSEALSVDTSNLIATTWTGRLLFAENEYGKAIPYLESALRANRTNSDLSLLLGLSRLRLKQLDSALDEFDSALKLRPDDPQLLGAKGTCLVEMFRHYEALPYLRRSLEFAPNSYGYLKLSELALTLGLVQEALTVSQKAIELESNNVEAQLGAARANLQAGRLEDANSRWRQAEQLASQSPELFNIKARSLIDRAMFKEAETEIQKSIELAPLQGEAYLLLTQSRVMRETDLPKIEQMVSALKSPGLSPKERSSLHFALAKSWNDLGLYRKAIGFYDQANEFRTKIFDSEGYKASVDEKIRVFTKELLSVRCSRRDSETPIFVVGMMRSGTTLIEQILASHPQIGTAGEQSFWSETAGRVINQSNSQLDIPLALERGRLYLDLLREIDSSNSKVVDKNPANCMNAGLLAFVYPNCRIVHVRRRPIDTALSIWMTPMNSGAPFMGNRTNIAFAYGQYWRLSDHWNKVIPSNNYLELDYEELVRDPNETIHKLLEFCGLPWNEACLNPAGNRGTVRTPSMWQVRQPIYTTSIDRWRNYEPWLGAFRPLLDLAR